MPLPQPGDEGFIGPIQPPEIPQESVPNRIADAITSTTDVLFDVGERFFGVFGRLFVDPEGEVRTEDEPRGTVDPLATTAGNPGGVDVSVQGVLIVIGVVGLLALLFLRR